MATGEVHEDECIHAINPQWCTICNGRDRAERLQSKKDNSLTYTLRKPDNE